MQILEYLDRNSFQFNKNLYNRNSFANHVSLLNKELLNQLSSFKVAILGIPEDRNSNNIGSSKGPDKIRESFYRLINNFEKIKIVDFGNIKNDKSFDNTVSNTQEVLSFIIDQKLFPVILGGSRNLTLAVYKAFQYENKLLNLTSINSRIDLYEDNLNDERNYLSEILLSDDSNIFNYTNIGYQSYFITKDQINLMNKLHYDHYRIGDIRNNILDIEPVLRDTNILELSVNAIKQADAPGNANPSPNGFYSEEICRLSKFAGMSDSLNAFCIFDFNPEYDVNNQTANLVSQILWYFLEGYLNKTTENPLYKTDGFTKFHVQNNSMDLKLDFYKSNKTGRWWLELPYTANLASNSKQLLSCSKDDYIMATNNEIPDRIWKFYKKML